MKSKVKNIVKVMQFHSLLRVDSSKKTAEKYFKYEEGITYFMNIILNNRNFILDKKMLKFDNFGRVLNIYIGNDLGFCGDFNTHINKAIKEDYDCDKIIIGKKIKSKKDEVLLSIDKDIYNDNIANIENILYHGIMDGEYKEINIVYNHYYNISKSEFIRKKVIPLEKAETLKGEEYKDDFAVEGDISDILVNLIVLYIMCELKVAIENSYASENVMRQSITRESLKKIDNLETERSRTIRKETKSKNFKRSLENVIKLNLTDDK